MKRVPTILLTLLLPITFAHSESNTPTHPTNEGTKRCYTLAWQDEFEGDALNEEVWNIEVNDHGGGNRELQYYRRENVTVEVEPRSGKSCLVLTARREDVEGRHFTSGRVNTLHKRHFTHGRVEASILLPKTADGLWPAFWMMGGNYSEVGWPRCGEIDIVEMGNVRGMEDGTQERYMNGACHWGTRSNGGHPSYAKHLNAPYSLQDGTFHLYTLIWDHEYLTMYLDLDKHPDAEPYFRMKITPGDDPSSAGHYFHHDFFLLFNLAVGGNFTRIWEPERLTALPTPGAEAKMYVDFVRYYRFENGKLKIEN